MNEDTFTQGVAPGADKQIDTSKLPAPNAAYMKEFEWILDEQFGIKVTNLSGHRIGFSKALPGPWRPITRFREILRGTLHKYKVATVHATDSYTGSSGQTYVQDEYD